MGYHKYKNKSGSYYRGRSKSGKYYTVSNQNDDGGMAILFLVASGLSIGLIMTIYENFSVYMVAIPICFSIISKSVVKYYLSFFATMIIANILLMINMGNILCYILCIWLEFNRESNNV